MSAIMFATHFPHYIVAIVAIIGTAGVCTAETRPLLPQYMYSALDRHNDNANMDSATMAKQLAANGVDVTNSIAASRSIASADTQSQSQSQSQLSPPIGLSSSVASKSNADESTSGGIEKTSQLHNFVQQLFIAQAQVQLEANEIQEAQNVATSAQQQLEDAAGNVRVITAALHAAQEAVASSALRAQTAQLQLAAHDQLLFAARQRVDALSAQMVGLQAEVGISAGKMGGIDLATLLNKLHEPLKESDKPQPVKSILSGNGGAESVGHSDDSKKPIHSIDNSPNFGQPSDNVNRTICSSGQKRVAAMDFGKRSSSLENHNLKRDQLKTLLEMIHASREDQKRAIRSHGALPQRQTRARTAAINSIGDNQRISPSYRRFEGDSNALDQDIELDFLRAPLNSAQLEPTDEIHDPDDESDVVAQSSAAVGDRRPQPEHN